MDMHAYPSICLHIHRYACISIDVHDVSRCIRIMHYLRGGVTPPAAAAVRVYLRGGVYPPRIMHALCITWGGYTPPWQAWGYARTHCCQRWTSCTRAQFCCFMASSALGWRRRCMAWLAWEARCSLWTSSISNPCCLSGVLHALISCRPSMACLVSAPSCQSLTSLLQDQT